MNSLVQCVLRCVLVVILGVPGYTRAQLLLEVPVGVRSYGLGEAGVADDSDPANVFFNPAILSSRRGVYLSASRPDFSIFLVDWDLYSVGAGGGYLLSAGPSREIRIGIDLRYTKLDMGEVVVSQVPVDRFARYFGLSLGAGITFNGHYHVGIGGSIKPFKEQKVLRAPFPPTVFPSEGNTTVFDLGLIASARVKRAFGTIIPSAGVSALNLGDDLEFSSFGVGRLPETIRLGLGLRFMTLPHAGLTEMLGTSVPKWSVAVVFDYEKPQQGLSGLTRVGVEAGLFDLVFVRAGTFDAIDGFGRPSGTTYGLGLNFPYKRYRVQLDYARFDPHVDAVNRFGGTVVYLY